MASFRTGSSFGDVIADLPPDLVERAKAVAVDQHLRDGIQPFIAGGAVDAAEGMQLFMLAEDFLDHHVERLCGSSLRIPDQAAQALEILRGIAQAVDVVEPQAL